MAVDRGFPHFLICGTCGHRLVTLYRPLDAHNKTPDNYDVKEWEAYCDECDVTWTYDVPADAINPE